MLSHEHNEIQVQGTMSTLLQTQLAAARARRLAAGSCHQLDPLPGPPPPPPPPPDQHLHDPNALTPTQHPITTPPQPATEHMLQDSDHSSTTRSTGVSCPACGLPPGVCPAAANSPTPATCTICSAPLATGHDFGPYDASPEVWIPPGMEQQPDRWVLDHYGDPLTWHSVIEAHCWLVQHASCPRYPRGTNNNNN